MPRFVLLYHDCPPEYERPSHWDLMFEVGEVLRTWALERLPRIWLSARSQTAARFRHCAPVAPHDSVSAKMLGDHRRDYLDLEGHLSGGRGAVIRVATGTFASERETGTEWKIALSNSAIEGKILLAQSDSSADEWTLRCLH
jgi:hypothetical protein